MRLISAILLCVAISASCLAASSDKPTAPQEHFDFGDYLSVDVWFNETKSENKLRLSKSYCKYLIKGGLAEKSPLMYAKVTRIVELVNCKNLTLTAQDQENLLDCKPAQDHLSKGSSSSTSSEKSSTETYTKRTTLHFRTEPKQLNLMKQKAEIKLYPFQERVVQSKIESCNSDNKLSKFNPEEPRLEWGYFFEYAFLKESILGVDCHGELLLSVNKTMTYMVESGYPTVEWLAEWELLREHALEDGLMLSLQNVVCEKPGFDLFGLKVNFIIAMQKQFPYLTVRHSMVSNPLEQLLNYQASVDQKRSQENADAYNTSISIVSRAALIDLLNFNLEQEFVNLETNSGFENMKLINPQLGMIVDSFWKDKDFVKSVNVYIKKNKDWLDKSIQNLTDAIQFQYANLDKSDHVVMTLKVLRTLVPSLDNILSFFDLDEKSGVQQDEPLDIEGARDEL